MDKVLHGVVAYGLVLTLHVVGAPAWLAAGLAGGGAVGWELRQTEPRVEHQQDLVAGLVGIALAEVLWQNSREGDRRGLLSDAYEAGAVDVADKAVYHAAYRSAAQCLGVRAPWPRGARILAGPVPDSWKYGDDRPLTFRGYASPEARAVVVDDSTDARMVAHELFHLSVGSGHGWYRPGCGVTRP